VCGVLVVFDASGNPKELSWGKRLDAIEDFSNIAYIAWGHQTPLFHRKINQLKNKCCFSIVFKDYRSLDGDSIALDLYNEDTKIVELWVNGLRRLINQSDDEINKLSKHGLQTLQDKEEIEENNEMYVLFLHFTNLKGEVLVATSIISYIV